MHLFAVPIEGFPGPEALFSLARPNIAFVETIDDMRIRQRTLRVLAGDTGDAPVVLVKVGRFDDVPTPKVQHPGTEGTPVLLVRQVQSKVPFAVRGLHKDLTTIASA
jgi:hypothetical protein